MSTTQEALHATLEQRHRAELETLRDEFATALDAWEVARAAYGEEVREACARWLRDRILENPFRFTNAMLVDAIRSTPLSSEPLKALIEELEQAAEYEALKVKLLGSERDSLKAELAATREDLATQRGIALTVADERDAALASVKTLETRLRNVLHAVAGVGVVVDLEGATGCAATNERARQREAERHAFGLKVAERVRVASAECVAHWPDGASTRIMSMILDALVAEVEASHER